MDQLTTAHDLFAAFGTGLGSLAAGGGAIAAAHKNIGLLLRLYRWVRPPSARIAITGMAGCGKTVLRDHLNGEPGAWGYEPPGMSGDLEYLKMKYKKRKLQFEVVPGQLADSREEALEKVFDGGPRGILHLVSFGYATTRQPDVRQALLRDGIDTIDKYRDRMLASELQELEGACEAIRRSARKKKDRKPLWLLLGVSKADLYADRIAEAYDHYKAGEVARRLDAMQNQIGSDRFQWQMVPVCAYPENFIWNGHEARTQIGSGERAKMLQGLLNIVWSYCA